MKKFKIFYAANRHRNAAYQLDRFLYFLPKEVSLRTAGYSLTNREVDWTLDPIRPYNKDLNIDKGSTSFGSNYFVFRDWIKAFNPDLIISDLEPVSIFIGEDLNIPTWNYSSLNLLFGTKTEIGHAYKLTRKTYDSFLN